MKSLTLASEFNLITRKSPVIEVCKQFIPQSVTLELRKCKNTSEEVRNAIATVSYRSAIISVPKARFALQAVCGILYGHRYLLNPSL